MNKVLTFLAYHNAVPIALGILFLGAGGALAATPAVQEAVYAVESSVQSVDNSYVAAVDLSQYPFALQVTAVTEDDAAYYVAYTLQTISLVDAVWQEVTESRTLTVAKDLLGTEDLGIYATEELSEVRSHERARLTETQQIERRVGVSHKVVATLYTGLVGALLDPTTQTFPSYVRVVADQSTVASSGAEVTPESLPDTQPPMLTMLGNHPTRIPLNSVYEDPGVVVTDDRETPPLVVMVDGVVVDSISIDTSRVWAYVITYSATDAAGNVTSVTRDVVIEGESGTTTVQNPVPTPEPTSEPIPEPTPEPISEPITNP